MCSTRKGRAWLAELELPLEERETLDSSLRQIDFLDGEIALVDRVIAHDAFNWPDARRLMTVPGVNLIVAVTFLAAVGDIQRFPDRRKLVAYLGLDPKDGHPQVRRRSMNRARWKRFESPEWSGARRTAPPRPGSSGRPPGRCRR